MARQLVRGPDIDDLISEAFTKVFVQLQRGGGPDVAFRAYLLTSIRRLHVDRARTNQRVQVTDDLEDLDSGVEFVDPATSDFERGAASRAFASLPERWQLVLWHLEVEGQKPADIAPLLGMSPNSVAALAYRAREGLRQAYLQSHLADTADEGCRWTTEHLGAYVRKGLAKRDSAKVEAHLDGCHRCTAVYLELIEVNSNLSGLLAPALLGLAAPGYLAASGTKIGLLLLWPWTKLKEAGAGAQAGAAGAAVAAVVAVAAVAGVFGGGGDDTTEVSEPSTQQTAPAQNDSPPDDQEAPKNDNTSPNNQQDPQTPPDEQPPPDEDEAPDTDEPPDNTPPPDEPPETPTDVTGTIRGSNVVLSWDAVDDARGYRVYRKSSPANAATGVAVSTTDPAYTVPASYPVSRETPSVETTPVAATAPVAYPAAAPGAGSVVSDGIIQQTSFRDDSLVDGNEYRYVVTAVGNGEESQISEPVTVTYNPSPTAPRKVRANERKRGITLRWATNPEPDIDAYRILRDGEQIGTTTSRRFTDDSAVDGSTYTYSVMAVDRSGQESGESRNVDATYDPVPSAPKRLSVDPRGRNAALSWNANNEPDIDGYNVYRDGEQITSVDRPRYVDTDTPDAPATYTVTAVDASGQESRESDGATFDATPRRPRGVEAKPTNDGIAVTWNANNESDLDHYLVRRSDGEVTATVNRPRYVDTDVDDGSTYAYRIVAVDNADNESRPSRPARAAYDPAPDAPTRLTAKVRADRVVLRWTKNSEPDIDGYVVYRNGARITKTDKPTYVDTDLTDGDTYIYRVRAIDETGQKSRRSEPATATYDPAPEAPTGLQVRVVGHSNIKVTWDQNSEQDLRDYIIIRNGVEITRRQSSTFLDSNLDDGTYEYRIVAVDDGGNRSAASEPDSVTVETPPKAPTGFYCKLEGTDLHLYWNANPEPDISGYHVTIAGRDLGTVSGTHVIDTVSHHWHATHIVTITAIDDAGNASPLSVFTCEHGIADDLLDGDLELDGQLHVDPGTGEPDRDGSRPHRPKRIRGFNAR